MRHWFFRLLSLLLVLVLLPGLGLFTLLGTESGSRWFCARVTAFIPGDLVLETVSGTFLERLEIQGVTYDYPPYRLQLGTAVLAWKPAALLNGRIHIRQVQVRHLRYEGPAVKRGGEKKKNPASWPEFRLPLAMQLDDLLLEDVEIRQGETISRLQRLAARSSTDDNVVQLQALDLEMAPLKAQLRGQASLLPPYALSVSLDWSAEVAGLGVLAGSGEGTGDLMQVQVNHHLSKPFPLKVVGTLNFAGEHPEVNLYGSWEKATWPLPPEKVRLNSQQGSFSLKGGLEDYVLDLTAGLSGIDIPEARLRLQAAGNSQGLRLQPLRLETLDGVISAQGPLSWKPVPTWDLVLRAEGVNPGSFLPDWPGKLDMESRMQGRYQIGETEIHLNVTRLAGMLKNAPLDASLTLGLANNDSTPVADKMATYSIQGKGSLHGLGLPPLHTAIKGSIDARSIDLENLTLEVLDGNLQVQGRIAWEPQPSWDFVLHATELNPAVSWPQWPGNLSLEGRSKGFVADGHPDFSLKIIGLDGDLRGYPLRARGEASLVAGEWSIPEAELESGENLLRLHGSVREKAELALDLQARDLAGLWPGLAGSLAGKAQISGDWDNPAIAAQFSGDALSFRDAALASLAVNLNLNPAKAGASRARLEAKGVSYQGKRASLLTLQGRGDLAQSSWQAAMEAEQANLTLAGTVGQQDESWQGEVAAIALDLKKYGTWRLETPLQIRADNESATLGRTCLVREEASFCVQGSRQSSGDLDLRGSMQALPLALAQSMLPERLRLQGSLNGLFSAQGPVARLRAHAELTPVAGNLIVHARQGEELNLAYHDALIKADYAEQRLDLSWGVSIAEEGRLGGAISLGSLRQDGERPLDGTVAAEFPSLHLLSAFIPRAEEIQGSLQLKAALSGTVTAPLIAGRAEIRDASARIPDLGIELEDIQLSLENRGMDRLVLAGNIHSGPGRLALAGEVLLSAKEGWPMDLTVQGERFEIARLPEVQALLSPDLKLTLQHGAATVSGSLKIPEARVELKELPRSAVQVSADEIIVTGKKGAESVQRREEKGVPLTSRVAMVLGDQVSFRGFGLKTRLVGSLEVKSSPGRLPTGQGALELREGRYKAYGQDLVIDQGRFLFNGPLDNPSLEVRAVRRAVEGEVLAGLRIRGNAKTPRTEVFSEPVMSRNEALSYLLTGRPPGKGGASGPALAQAALSMGLDRSEGLMQSVGRSVGLDTLGVESGGDFRQTSLAIGKYLTPDLYLSYALGLFDKEGAIELKHRLTDHLSVKTRSGKAQSMDLIYSIER